MKWAAIWATVSALVAIVHWWIKDAPNRRKKRKIWLKEQMRIAAAKGDEDRASYLELELERM